MYQGFGDFDKDGYEWYFGWSEIKPLFQQHVPSDTSATTKLLMPGMGNDPLLLDLVGAGYRDITAFDYSEGAVERQAELLSYDSNAEDAVTLLCRDARALDEDWTNAFDAVLAARMANAEAESIKDNASAVNLLIRGGFGYRKFCA